MGFENGKLVRVTLRAEAGDGEEQVNTFHYDLDDSGVGDNDPQALADRFRDDVRPVWGSLYRSTWTLDPVVVTMEKDPQNPLAPRSQWTSGAATPGTNGGSDQLLPPGLAVVVALNTDLIGRRFRGRLWLSGSLQEADQNAGSFVSGYLTGIATIMAAVPHEPDICTGDCTGTTAKWCVYSRTQRAQNLDPYAVPITSDTVRTLVHNLRRRTLYA